MALDLSSFYMLVIPEQDSQGKVLINRKSGSMRNWYYCSQAYDSYNNIDGKVLKIANQARIVALSEAYDECGYRGEFNLAKPKGCNELTARLFMTGKLVIILDNFNIEEQICDIHNGYFCRSIDDDPRVWKKIHWGKKSFRKKWNYQSKKPFVPFKSIHHSINTLEENMPEELKKVNKQ